MRRLIKYTERKRVDFNTKTNKLSLDKIIKGKVSPSILYKLGEFKLF